MQLPWQAELILESSKEPGGIQVFFSPAHVNLSPGDELGSGCSKVGRGRQCFSVE